MVTKHYLLEDIDYEKKAMEIIALVKSSGNEELLEAIAQYLADLATETAGKFGA